MFGIFPIKSNQNQKDDTLNYCFRLIKQQSNDFSFTPNVFNLIKHWPGLYYSKICLDPALYIPNKYEL